MKMNHILLIVVFFANSIIGCSVATGSLFHEVPLEEHKGKAVVYFFRNSSTGSVWTLDLRINGGNALPLQNKGYHLLILDPGTYNFAVSRNSKLYVENTFNLQGDRTYYIRYWAGFVSTSPGLFVTYGTPVYFITSVPRDAALEILQKCRLIELPGTVKGQP